ncbi:thioredoxin family protein [Bacillus sp. FSL W7-1334]|uniref:thioredoxin family protein n=1 Tax=Bacillus sp. FSL W7-1334 TaxID=2921703 RepID=UPI0030FB0686|nr:thioredoxin family protein [Bacillus cereus]
MKKIIFTSTIIITIFILLSVITIKNQNNNKKENFLSENATNPKETQNILNENKDITIYFYSPTCEHCKKTTPLLSELNEEENINVKTFNLQEFEEGWENYNIKGTPTIIHYKNGKEEKRLIGEHSKKDYQQWLENRKVVNKNN